MYIIFSVQEVAVLAIFAISN